MRRYRASVLLVIVLGFPFVLIGLVFLIQGNLSVALPFLWLGLVGAFSGVVAGAKASLFNIDEGPLAPSGSADKLAQQATTVDELLAELDRWRGTPVGDQAALMRPVAEELSRSGHIAGFNIVPWDWQSFGIYPPGPSIDREQSPVIGVWLDTTDPTYAVQLRTGPDGEDVASEGVLWPDEAAAAVVELFPRLVEFTQTVGTLKQIPDEA